MGLNGKIDVDVGCLDATRDGRIWCGTGEILSYHDDPILRSPFPGLYLTLMLESVVFNQI